MRKNFPQSGRESGGKRNEFDLNSASSDSAIDSRGDTPFRVNKSRPVFTGLLNWQLIFPAFVFGLLAVKWFFPAICLLVVYALTVLSFKVSFRGVLFLPLLFACGFYYAQFYLPKLPETVPSWMEQRKKVDISGVVKTVRGYPDSKFSMELQDVVCRTPEGKEQSLKGLTVWTWYKPLTRPMAGQTVKLHARIKPIVGFRNPGVWDYTFYAHTKNRMYRVFSNGKLKNGKLGPPVDSFLANVRKAYLERIESLSPAGQGGAFFPALLSGDRFYLSQRTVDLLRKAGLSHTLALSGLHVGFVVGLGIFAAFVCGYIFPSVYLYIPRQKLAVLFSGPLVVFYLWMGGFTPSLLRASCMFCFWGLLLLLDRPKVLLDGLFLAVALILLFSPLSVFDIGLQFSALAVLGISLFFEPFYAPFKQINFPGAVIVKFFAGILVVSLCANLTLLPLLIWNFGIITPNILFNVFWIPVLGTVVMPVCAFGGLILSFLWHDGGTLLFSCGAHLIDFMLYLLKNADKAGWLPEYSCYRPLWSGMAAYYLLLVTLLYFYFKRRVSVVALIFVILLCSFSVYKFYEHRGVLRVTVIDTGQSQSVLIQGPRGSRTLVDGGGTFGSFDMGRSIVGPFLTHGHLPRLDRVILSHKDYDHSEGLAFVLENFDVGEFCYNGRLPSGWLGKRYKKALSEKSIPTRILNAGEVVVLEPGLKIEVLSPPKKYHGSANNCSLVLRVLLNGVGMVFLPGDIEKKGIIALLKNHLNLKSELLVLPHHGSSSSFVPDLYSRIAPVKAFAACGYLNRFGFVSQIVREELEKQKIKLFTTAGYGALEFNCN